MSSNYRLVAGVPAPTEFVNYEPYSLKGLAPHSFAFYSIPHASDTELTNIRKTISVLTKQGKSIGLCEASFRPEILVFSLRNNCSLKEYQPQDFAKLSSFCMNIKAHLFVISDESKPFVAKLGPKDALLRASQDSISPGYLFGGQNELLKHSLNRYEWLKTLSHKYNTSLEHVAFITDRGEEEELQSTVGYFISAHELPKNGLYLQTINSIFLSLLLFGRDISSIRGEI